MVKPFLSIMVKPSLSMVSLFLLHYQMSPNMKESCYVYLLSNVKFQLSRASKLENPYNFWTYIIVPSFICARFLSWMGYNRLLLKADS